MPSHEASTMARPRTDPPDVASSRQRFVEPMDIFADMTAMAWDKIHIFADMASNKMIQYVQPFRMRKPDENEKGEYDKSNGSSTDTMIGPMTQIHNIAKDGVAYKVLLFDPDNQPPGQFTKHRPTAEMFKLHIKRIFITDDPADIMPSYRNSVESVTESDDPPLNVSRYKRDQGRQLEALIEGEESDNRQHEGVHDDHHHETTCPMHATHESIAVGEQNHEARTCLIMFDEAHKLHSETDNDNVSSKSATEMTVIWTSVYIQICVSYDGIVARIEVLTIGRKDVPGNMFLDIHLCGFDVGSNRCRTKP
jgi:hypothetical protein